MKKSLPTAAVLLRMLVLIGLTFVGLCALFAPSDRAFADTPPSNTDCGVATASSGTSGGGAAAVATSSAGVATAPSGTSGGDTAAVATSSATPSDSGLALTGLDVETLVMVSVLLGGSGLLLYFGARLRRRRRSEILGCAAVGLLMAHLLFPSSQASAASSCSPLPAVLPESPIGVVLPIAALLIFVAAWVWSNHRNARA